MNNNKIKGLVSTLICTYNAEQFFKGTIESVLDQTYKNQEILIRDDGSTDNTIDIIKEYQKKDNRIKFWTSKDLGKKLGPYGGLNFLIDKSKGEFIAIQDHDDIWHPEKLEIQVNFMKNNPEYIGCGTNVLMYFGKSKIGYIYKNNSIGTRVIHTSLMFRNEGFKYDTKIMYLCDGYFMQNILTKGESILANIDTLLSLHFYKENKGNLSELWGGFSYENIKRYFDVYGFSFINLFNAIYFSLRNMFFPYRLQKWITFNLSLKDKLLNTDKLNQRKDCKIMLNYLNNK